MLSVTSTGAASVPTRLVTRALAPSARPRRWRRPGGPAACSGSCPSPARRRCGDPRVVDRTWRRPIRMRSLVAVHADGGGQRSKVGAESGGARTSTPSEVVFSTPGSRGSSAPRSTPCGWSCRVGRLRPSGWRRTRRRTGRPAASWPRPGAPRARRSATAPRISSWRPGSAMVVTRGHASGSVRPAGRVEDQAVDDAGSAVAPWPRGTSTTPARMLCWAYRHPGRARTAGE